MPPFVNPLYGGSLSISREAYTVGGYQRGETSVSPLWNEIID